MFLGSAESTPGRMKLFSIVSSAQRHCLSIQDYLDDAFLKLSQAAQNSPKDLELGSALLMSLLPDRWQPPIRSTFIMNGSGTRQRLANHWNV